MSFPSITFTLLNGTKIDEVQINQNFTDLVDSLSDGTKDLNINDAIITGTATGNSLSLTGDTTLGDRLLVTGDSELSGTLTTNDDATTKRLGFTSKTSEIIDTSLAIEPEQSYIELNSQIYEDADFSSIEITATVNDRIDFDEGVGELTATITAGTYIPTALATEIETKLNAVGQNLYIVTYSSVNERFTITVDESTEMLWATGTNHSRNAGVAIGIDIMVDETAVSFVSDYQYQILYSDSLETITATNFSANDIIVLNMVDDATSLTMTLDNGGGNINCGSDRVMNTITDKAILIYDGTNWNLVSFSAN